MTQRPPGCPDCGCDRDDHAYVTLPCHLHYACEGCGECDRTFDPGDEIDAAMLLADEPA